MNPFGIDVSSWQANKEGTLHMDWVKAKAAGIQFAFIKATEGANYLDTEFAYNWSELQRLNIPHGAYHFFRPSQPISQVQMFVDIVQPTEGELLVLDVENSGGLLRQALTEKVRLAVELIKQLSGRYPIIYSRASWLDANLDVLRLPKLDYWLAQYYLAMPYPVFTKEYPTDAMRIPIGVSKEQVKFHQTGEKGNGKMYGAQSHYIDTDRFLGTVDEKTAYFYGANVPPVISPEVKPLFQAKVTAYRLIIRDAPAGKDTGMRLSEGHIVYIYKVSGDWYQLGDGGWVSALWVQRLDIQPPVELNLLNVPVFSQNDPRWKDLRLGTSGTTIGWNGCLITAHCSVAKYYGFDLNPASYNAWLTGHAGYVNANWYVWDSLPRLYPLEIATWVDCYNIPAPLIKIDEALARKEPCIVHVDFVPSTNIVNDHYITIDGKLPDGDYHIVDSWDGWRGSFKSRYVNPERYIYRIVSYRRR